LISIAYLCPKGFTSTSIWDVQENGLKPVH